MDEAKRDADDKERELITRRRVLDEEERKANRREHADRYSEMKEVRPRSRSDRRVERVEERPKESPRSRAPPPGRQSRDRRSRDSR